MRLNDIINRFSLLSDLSKEEVSKWTVLCVDTMKTVEGRLFSKRAAEEENNALRLANAAAALAFYKYTLCVPETAVKNFTAGSVTVAMAMSERERAKTLWEEEERLCADLMRSSEDFRFLEVRV